MTFCSYIKTLIAVCFLCLTASTSLASKVYPDCEIGDSGPGLCIWEWEYDTYIAPRGSNDISPVRFSNYDDAYIQTENNYLHAARYLK